MRIVDAQGQHLSDLLRQPLRQVDVDEWVLSTGRPVPEVLCEGFSSGRALIDDGGRCRALWGVMPSEDPRAGFVWLIAAEAASRSARALHRFWREEFARMHRHYEHLVAVTHHTNTRHHRWLSHIGFRLTQRGAFGPCGSTFLIFVRSKESHDLCAR